VAMQAPREGISLAFALDVTGMATTVRELQASTGTQSLAVGASSFDPSLEPYVFPGLSFGGRWLATRGLALLLGAPVFLLAWWRFHRFDPARVRGGGRAEGKGYVRALQGLVRPLTSRLTGRLLAGVGRRPGLLGATAAEAALTLVENPLGVVVLVVALATSITAASAAGGLPLIVAAMAVVVAGAACREGSYGTRPLVFAAPRLLSGFVAWKLGGALILCWLFAAPAALRLATSDPGRALVLLAGAFFVAAAATAGGVLTGSSKAFLALFLLFWYVVLNDGGKSPGLDFGSFHGTATPRTAILYLTLGLALLGSAQAAHWWRARVA